MFLLMWGMLKRPHKALLTVYYYIRLKHCGRNADFEPTVIIRNPRKISIGDNCSFSNYVILDGHASIAIGNNCMFANRVTVSTATHDYLLSPIDNKIITKPVVIGNDVWLGIGAIVLCGVTIGNGAVIGALALVNKDIPDNAVVAGNPARILRYRPTSENNSNQDNA